MKTTKRAIRPCPICDGEVVELLHTQRFVLPEGHRLPASFDIVCCPSCGFAYADTPVSQAVYDEYYAGYSKYEDQSATGGGRAEFDARRLHETAAMIAAVVQDRPLRMLDLGCANGGLLEELKQLGFKNLTGIDPSPRCVETIRETHNIAAARGSIRRLPAGIGTFDVVILSHVLEHVADLHAAVLTLVTLLAPGGWCYVEVPDALRYREFVIAPFQDFNIEHINHFSLSSLGNLFARHGFIVEGSGQKNIESSPGCPYPAAYMFLRAGTEKPIALRRDDTLAVSLLSYIEASAEKLKQIEARLVPLAADPAGLLVWGAGQLTIKLLAETSLQRARIHAFIDSNPVNQGKILAGIPIISPAQLTDRTTPILLATLLHEKAIIGTIRDELQLPNPIVVLSN